MYSKIAVLPKSAPNIIHVIYSTLKGIVVEVGLFWWLEYVVPMLLVAYRNFQYNQQAYLPKCINDIVTY
jgi:hypothetical protein